MTALTDVVIDQDVMTARQLDVCRHIAAGHTGQQTADHLGIGFWTTKEHLRRARAALHRHGHPDTNGAINLRRALRALGLIDDLELL